jgi:hypothetical protein
MSAGFGPCEEYRRQMTRIYGTRPASPLATRPPVATSRSGAQDPGVEQVNRHLVGEIKRLEPPLERSAESVEGCATNCSPAELRLQMSLAGREGFEPSIS